MTARHELVNEALAIRTVAADLHARLLNSKDANETSALSAKLADLFDRHEEIMARITRTEKAA